MESAQPEIWTLFPQNAAVPAVFHALSAALKNPREAI
jgi:hypothetical protein